MSNFSRIFHPYTFRNRMVSVLLISSVVAGVIALGCSFLYSAQSVREDLSLNQHALAIYLLELDQKTDLTLEEMIDIVGSDIMSVRVETVLMEDVPAEVRDKLPGKMIVTTGMAIMSIPSTYVQLAEHVVRIMPSRRMNIFMVSFVRIGFAALSFLLTFLLMAWLASNNIAKPITTLTQATRRISDGDFSVKLPDDAPGEVGELMKSFNSMTDALARTSYLQKDFISSISHEFRTPIASIRGFARLLQMDGLDEASRKEYVKLIAQESDRLSRLSETLLRLSALEQQAAPASLQSFRLDEQIRQVILRLEPAWSPREIEWQLDLQPVTLVSDNELLDQVWINLIQNAVKFSESGSVIEISVLQTDKAEVCITDHGIGMDAETVSRIFDRFYQGDKSRSHQGVGLGLSLVKRILTILHGEIHVYSVPGEGSSFRVRLPLNHHYGPMEEQKHE
ncbi:MAG: ATP-binding protein [Aristaeellaceae bacterium]